MEAKVITVGELKKALAALPDDAAIKCCGADCGGYDCAWHASCLVSYDEETNEVTLDGGDYAE